MKLAGDSFGVNKNSSLPQEEGRVGLPLSETENQLYLKKGLENCSGNSSTQGFRGKLGQPKVSPTDFLQ